MKAIYLVAALTGLASVASAKSNPSPFHEHEGEHDSHWPVKCPELDPSSLMTAAVVAGGALVLARGRKAK